jgi:hypothetical protein
MQMMSSRDDHYELGVEHAKYGHPRYVFQDPVLQERYDRGYKDAIEGRYAERIQKQRINEYLPGEVDIATNRVRRR